MKKTLVSLLLLVSVLVFSGCAKKAQIVDINSTNYSMFAKKLTMAEMSEAVGKAAQRLKWQAKSVGDNQVQVMFSGRGYTATVLVTFKADMSYNISYVTSTGLGAKNGYIHRNYNRWIIKLRDAIDKSFSIELADKQ